MAPPTSESKPRRLLLWCNPRSGSTALAKCLSFLDDDTEVWFEPFTFSRVLRINAKKEFNIDVPKDYTGHENIYQGIIQGMRARIPFPVTIYPELLGYEGIKQQLESSTSRTVVVKEMAVASHESYDYIPSGFRHVILIRDPRRVIPSFRKMLLEFKGKDASDTSSNMEEVHDTYPTLHWYGEMYSLWQYIREHIDVNPLIIDTEDFLSDPAMYLKKICELINVEYRDDLLQWDPAMDVVKKWKQGCMDLYTNGIAAGSLAFKRAFCSSEFVPTSSSIPSLEDLTPDCVRIIGKCQAMYDEMYQHRMKPKI